jgi:hypothetical protein
MLNLRAEMLLRYLRTSPRVAGCAEMAESLEWTEELKRSPADLRCVLFSGLLADLHFEFAEFQEMWLELEEAGLVRDGDLHSHTLLTFRFGPEAVNPKAGSAEREEG